VADVNGALLDTSIVIAAGASVDALPPTAAISVLTLGELRAGILLAATEAARSARQARLDAVRAAFSPLPVDEDVADAYGEVIALARRTRRTTKASDALIVATASATGRTLVTSHAAQAGLARAAGVDVRR
jgi:predicted nucleic acid-binding protein